jgi:hypothetical protein
LIPDTPVTSEGSGKGIDHGAERLVTRLDNARRDTGIELGLLQFEQGLDDAGLAVWLTCLRYLGSGALRSFKAVS